MTKKQLSKKAEISITRITQLMKNMNPGIDFIEEKRGEYLTQIVFTESGINKIMNRNTKTGRKVIPKHLHAKRKKKISTLKNTTAASD